MSVFGIEREMKNLIAVACVIALASSTPADEPPRLNILWLIAEDFGNHLSCCGTKEVSTPNLDRLAAEGIRYRRFYTVAPVCSPSRSAFMTGMYQTSIGAHQHRSHRDDGYALPAGVRLITHRRLRQVLDEWIVSTDDQGRNPEPAGLIKSMGTTKPGTHPNSGYALPRTPDKQEDRP